MKKCMLFFMTLILTAGCNSPSKPETTPEPTPTPAVTAEATAESTTEPTVIPTETPEPIETKEIEVVLEQELPMSLRVTIQDFEVTFAKSLDYVCEDELNVSDYIVITYTGEIESNPVAVRAEKKK